jgi:hypothetical protein
MKEFFDVATVEDAETAKRLFQSGDASALIRVPTGFQDAVLAGRKTVLQLYGNPLQTFLPNAVDNVLQRCTVVANGLMAHASDPAARIQALSDAVDGGGQGPTEGTLKTASGDRAAPRLARLAAIQDISVAIERPPGKRAGGVGSDPREFFGYIFPGLALFGLFFISQALAQRLLRDRRRGLQRRVAMTPVSPASVIAGGILYTVSGLLILLVLLGLIGKVAFRIELRDTPALFVLGLGFAVFAASLPFAIAGQASTDHGSQAAGGVVVLLLSLIGGSFIPVESYPPFLRVVAYLMPNGAVQQGMVERGLARRLRAYARPAR